MCLCARLCVLMRIYSNTHRQTTSIIHTHTYKHAHVHTRTPYRGDGLVFKEESMKTDVAENEKVFYFLLTLFSLRWDPAKGNKNVGNFENF